MPQLVEDSESTHSARGHKPISTGAWRPVGVPFLSECIAVVSRAEFDSVVKDALRHYARADQY
jgi:hypothetical protein